MKKGLRIVLYLAILIILGVSIEYKKDILRAEAGKAVVSVLGYKLENGLPVEIKKLELSEYKMNHKITLQKCGRSVCFYVPYTMKNKISKNDMVYSEDGKTLLAKVLSKDNAANYANGLHKITVSSGRALKDYISEKEFRTALLKYGQSKKGIIIPTASIFVDTVGSFVWIERDGRVAKREIEMDVSVLDNAILVKKGLSPGDHLVVAGGELLNSGDKIKDISARSEVKND